MRASGLVVIGTLILAGITAVIIEFSADIRMHRTRVANGSRMIQTCRGPVELAEIGDGPPLLVVHGTGGGFDQGMSAGADLAVQGLRVIAPSRFGYLRTPYPADASAQAQADQFMCVLDALGIQRVSILGVSAGANSAMQFAIRHPERASALILLVPAAYKGSTVTDGVPPRSRFGDWLLMKVVSSDFLFWFVHRYARGTAINRVLATPIIDYQAADADERRRAERTLSEILPISARAQGLLNDARIAGNPPRYDLEAIHVPTLAISVRDDLYGTYAAAQYTVQHVEGARLIGYERGGHLWLGHHAETISQIAAFVKQQAAATASGVP